MGDLEKYSSIKELGSQFKLTEVQFWIDCSNGLPFDEACYKYVIDEDAYVSNIDAEIHEEDKFDTIHNGLDLITSWHEFVSKGDQICNRRDQDLIWKPPLDMDSLTSVYGSKDDSKTDSEDDSKTDGLRGDVNPLQIHNERLAGLELTDADIHKEIPEEDKFDTIYNGGDLFTAWHKFVSKGDQICNLIEQDLMWKPPLDMDSLTFVYGSKDDSKDDSKTDGLSDDVNPLQIHNERLAGLELTGDNVDRRLSGGSLELDDVLMEDYWYEISEYWFDRYILFSKYGGGIKMDKEGWFSTTPECIAKHHAFRCGKGVVVDCFTGVGGNAISFAPISTHVIAIDSDPKRIELAQHNAAVYGVKENIEFIQGDCFILAQKLKVDTVFVSPPRGGPEYAKTSNFDMKTMIKPHDGQSLFNMAKQIAPRVVMFLPINVDFGQLAELSLSASPPWTLEVEKNIINGELKAITAYFTDPSLVKTG